MADGDWLGAIGGARTGGYFVHGRKNLGAVVAIAALITHTYHEILMKPFLCLKDSRATLFGLTVPTQYSHW